MIMWEANKFSLATCARSHQRKFLSYTDAGEGPDGCRNTTSADDPPRTQNPNRPPQTPKPRHPPNEGPGLPRPP